MKRLLIIPLLLFVTIIKGQDSAIVLTAIDSIPAKQSVLFTRAQLWVNDNFKSAKNVTQIADKEAGVLTGDGNLDIQTHYTGMGMNALSPDVIKFSFKILVRDGKYRYEFTNISSESLGRLYTSDKCPTKWPMVRQKKMDQMYKETKDVAMVELTKMIEGLKKAMVKTEAF